MSELLADGESWCVSGLGDAETFFRNVPAMLPEATHLLLEGAPASDIAALLSSYVTDIEYPAFDDPLFVAKIVPRERVEDFCRATGGRLLDAGLHPCLED